MGIEYGAGKAAGFEQAEAEQHRVTHAGPDGGAYIGGYGDVLHQHRVDRHTDHNEKCLKAQGEQGAQIVLSHLTPFPVCHGRHGDGCHGSHQIYLNHASINDNENADGDCPGADTHEQGLKPQPQQRTHIHFHEPAFQIRDHRGNVDAGVSDHHPGSAVDNALGSIKDAHNNGPGVGNDENRGSTLEHPFEEHPGVNIIEVIAVCNELNQLQGHDDCQNRSGQGENHIIGKVLNHVEDTAVPRLGRQTNLTGDLADLLIGGIEHSGQVADNAADEDFFQPIRNAIPDKIHGVTSDPL